MKHYCHAYKCQTEVPPEMLMCRRHWGMVPSKLKSRVKKEYQRGQCETRQVSVEWLKAAREAINAVREAS